MDSYKRREKIKLEILEEREEKPHFHQDIELLYVLKGSMDVRIGEQVSHMEKEDLLIINANQQHQLRADDGSMYVKLTVLYELMGDVLEDQDVFLMCDSTENDDDSCDGLRRLIQKLLSYYLSVHGNVADFTYISLCYQIMAYLTEHFLVHTNEKISGSESDKYRERVRQIDNYIRSNFRSQISIKDLAERMYLSDGYLSRFFKQHYGMSFARYLTNVRLHHAVDELLYTDIPITRISYDNGFPSAAIFNKTFKQNYGMTPSQMRKRDGPGTTEENPVLTEETKKKLEDVLWKDIPEEDMSAAGVIEETLDAEKTRPYTMYLNEVINAGSASDLLRSEVQEHVRILIRTLHFKYIRFWSPFSKEMLIDVNDTVHSYNFSRLDFVLDFLLDEGARPFIDLAGKPKRLQETDHSSLLYDVYEGVDSLKNWISVMNAFVRHILLRYGKEEVDQWKFELWFDIRKLNQPVSVLNYLEQLKMVLKILHESTNAPVGAAGLHGTTKGENGQKTDAVGHFFEQMVKQKILPDFLSVYIYAYDEKIVDGKLEDARSTDPDLTLHTVERLKKLRLPELKELPVFVTEWNLTVSDRNLINDTCFKGAWIVRNYIDLFGKVDGMAYFRGSDRLSEYYDTNRLLFGGMGLLTKDGIMKPAAFAFDFMNRLYNRFIGKGRNYIATTNGLDHYGILCHNCKKLNYHYYCVDEDRLDGDHLKQYFEELDPLTLKIHLTHVKNGTYHVKFYRINTRHGSVLQMWGAMNKEPELSRSDIEYFKKACIPNLSMQNIEVKNGQADLKVMLEANEIMFIRLRRREDLMEN